MGLWQFQFSELCCVQMCFQKVWTSNWMFLGSIVWCVRTPVIMCTHVVRLWQWSAKWLAWFSFYVSLCIQASHYFLNTSLVWYSPYTTYWLPQIYEKKLYFSIKWLFQPILNSIQIKVVTLIVERLNVSMHESKIYKWMTV